MVGEHADQHQSHRRRQGRQAAMIAPFLAMVGMSADQNGRYHPDNVWHRGQEADHHVALHAEALDEGRAPEPQRRVGADQAKIDQRQ